MNCIRLSGRMDSFLIVFWIVVNAHSHSISKFYSLFSLVAEKRYSSECKSNLNQFLIILQNFWIALGWDLPKSFMHKMNPTSFQLHVETWTLSFSPADLLLSSLSWYDESFASFLTSAWRFISKLQIIWSFPNEAWMCWSELCNSYRLLLGQNSH